MWLQGKKAPAFRLSHIFLSSHFLQLLLNNKTVDLCSIYQCYTLACKWEAFWRGMSFWFWFGFKKKKKKPRSWIQESTCMTSGLEWFGFLWTAWTAWDQSLDFFFLIKSRFWYSLSSSLPPLSPLPLPIKVCFERAQNTLLMQPWLF